MLCGKMMLNSSFLITAAYAKEPQTASSTIRSTMEFLSKAATM